MRRQVVSSVRGWIVLTLIFGLAYPLLMTGVAQALFRSDANGSMITNAAGRVVGSRLIGQGFTDAKYFHPRPSAAGSGYDPTATGASNLGPTNPTLAKLVSARVASYRAENRLAPDALVPVDAVTASGSGLDPDISVANAVLQTPRVAVARNLTTNAVRALVHKFTHHSLGIDGVNVLELNLALDRLSP